MDRKQWEDPIRTTDNTASGYSPAHRKQTQEKKRFLYTKTQIIPQIQKQQIHKQQIHKQH